MTMIPNKVPYLCILFPWFLFAMHITCEFTERSTYIIHINKLSKPRTFFNSSPQSWHHSIVSSLKFINQSFSPSLLYSYHNAISGFSALLSLDELRILQKHHAFIHAYKDKTSTLDTTHALKFLSLDHSKGLWPASNYGEDVVVGVIDSGIWPESASFKSDGISGIPEKWKGVCQTGEQFDTSMCNSKLIGARYFNQGVLAATNKVRVSMSSARDTSGHGTATASIIAGNYLPDASYFGYAKGIAKGVAPRARLAVYKVDWEEGQYSSDVLAGFDRAILDGVDVICITLGYYKAPLFDDPIAAASFTAMERGILVSCSAGNNGPSLGTLHNGLPWVLTVGAGTIDRSFAGTITLGNMKTIVGWTLFPASASARIENLPLVYNKTFSSCDSLELLSEAPHGIILCDRAINVFEQIRCITISTNIVAAAFISNDPKLLEIGGMTCAGVVINPKDAPIVIEYVTTSPTPRASIEFQQTILDIKPSPVASYYSSRGPSPNFPWILKPDVMAPGTLILASWIQNAKESRVGQNIKLSSNFSIKSGTSIACPIAAGVAALLKSVYPKWSAAAIRSAMMTTANPLDNTFFAIKDTGRNSKPATPFAIGAGLVDPNKALKPGLIYDATPQDYVNLLCALGYSWNQIFKITNSYTYSCSNPSLDLNYPSFIAFYEAKRNSTVTKTFRRTVTNVGISDATYKSFLIPPRGTFATVSPTTLAFKERYEKKSYTLTIQYRGDNLQTVSFGELVWKGQNGKYNVRSPIVISRNGLV